VLLDVEVVAILICESTRDGALCAVHTLEERAGRDVAAMNPAPRRMLAKGQSPEGPRPPENLSCRALL
jgi:hypothetical protein